MSTFATHPSAATPAVSTTSTASRSASLPWYIWTGVAAVTSASIGGAWDVSWHRSIGRDTFWTPAHMAIQACAVLAAIVGLWLVFQATTGRDPELRAASVSVLGLRGPLGIFLAGWGGVAMLTSAPFDNWWHNAYGLDVKIISPPHVLLILGVRGVSIGMMFLILAAMNRAAAANSPTFPRLQQLFLYLGGLTLVGNMFFMQEYTPEVHLHQVLPYILLAGAVPILFAILWQASRFRWAATTITTVYLVMGIAEILILPLFPAQPKLGPVFYPVTHFVPGKFPLLIIAPAIALDLLWQRILPGPGAPGPDLRTRAATESNWKLWQIALISGVVFTVTLVLVEWPFANFLMSHASQNRFFGTMYFDYNSRPNGLDRLRHFAPPDHGLVLLFGLMRASLYASISTWLGLLFGRWMRGVQR